MADIYRQTSSRADRRLYIWHCGLRYPSPMLQTCCRRAVLHARARPASTLTSIHKTCAIQPCTLLARPYHVSPPRHGQDGTALRKQLKDAAKAKKTEQNQGKSASAKDATRAADWELTVGIEIHAQLNAARKLFSSELKSGHMRTTTDSGRRLYVRDRRAQRADCTI